MGAILFLLTVTMDIFRMLDGVETVTENEIVIVDVPKYISDFSKLIVNTPARIQVY